MAGRRYPCFFKILLDPSAPHLPLPPDFVKTHLENNIPKDPILRSATGGYSWRLKIKKIGESWCLSDGWDCVVDDIKLGFGDFLVFRFDCKNSFKLVVFSPNGCEKDFPPNTQMDNSNINNNINTNNSNVSDSGIDDDDDDVEDDDDDDDDDVENNVSEDVDDDEDEMDDDDEDEEEEEEVYVEKDDVDDDDDDGGDDDDDEGGGYIDGHDGDPFFMVVISKGHKAKLRLPVEFARLAGIDYERTLTVANLDGKEWELAVRADTNQTESFCLSAGWATFRLSNDLSEGDECVFKFILDEDKLLLARVIKSKRAAKTPVKAKIPESEVAKRKRELPERKSGRIPAKEVETRAARGVDEKKRPRGRPSKRKRGRPARQK